MSSDEPIDVADYHERTKHRFDRYARGPETIDWDAQPDLFRRFDGAPFTLLPLAAEEHTLPFAALFGGETIPAQPLDISHIALLLEISLGLSAWKQYGNARWSLRCNPSSGNLHPTEAYLLCSGIGSLEDALYHYRADKHALEQRCRLPAGEAQEVPVLLLGLSSIHWREAWKYGERAWRYCQLDVGHALAALGYAAATLGWQITPLYHLGDERLARLLGIDRGDDFSGAEAEQPDLLIAIHPAGAQAPALEAPLARSEQGEWAGQANVLDPHHHYQWPVIEAVATTCQRPAATPNKPHATASPPPPLPSPCHEAAATLFRRRRSAQAFDGSTTMTQEAFFRLLDHLLPRPALAPWDGVPWAARIHPVLFVHRVEGVAPGLYALPRRSDALAQLKSEMRPEFLWERLDAAPPHLPLYRLISARAERTAAKLSCQQAIAGDSAFSLAMLAEFGEGFDEAPWRYRELYWEAGTVGQVLYLEAEALGLRGTGIGCFFDDGVHELLGITTGRLQSLYHFTVGGALHDSRIITLPPYTREQ